MQDYSQTLFTGMSRGPERPRAELDKCFSTSELRRPANQYRWTIEFFAVFFYYGFRPQPEKRVPYPVGGLLKTLAWVFNRRGSKHVSCYGADTEICPLVCKLPVFTLGG
jgi:hypothetical protein